METLDIVVTEEDVRKLTVETSEPVGIDFWLDFYREFMGTEIARFPADNPGAGLVVLPNMRHHRRFNPKLIETDENIVKYRGHVCAEISFEISSDSIDSYTIDGSMYSHADPMNALENVFSQLANPAESCGGQEVARLVKNGKWDRLASIGNVDEDMHLELIHTKMRLKRYKLLNEIIEKVSEEEYQLGKVIYIKKDYSTEKDSVAEASSSEAGC